MRQRLPIAVLGLALALVATASVQAADQDAKSKYPDYNEFLKDAEKIDGLIPLHKKDGNLYAELTSSTMNKDLIVLISISRGIGEGSLLGGMSWGFGDDWLWQFRKVDDDIQVVRRNVRFTAKKGSPEEKAVAVAYNDSVLFSLPIKTVSPAGASVIDLTSIFKSDLPQIGRSLPGFSFSSSRSSFAAVKGFDNNVEIEVAATYGSSGNFEIDSVADSRGVTVNVHYSISKLPSNGYTPRLADDRVGYFLTVHKDFSKKGSEDRFVRYINRWDLQKADSSADMSPPKQPIIFWLEKTVPFKYRAPIRAGILEWNKAFEKAGFVNAIEVRQQPDNADWDPEDINYNTFRWITAGAGFAMGPSRVNPLTGQILDADIIFDADFIQYWKESYETFSEEDVAAMTGGPLDLESHQKMLSELPIGHRHSAHCRCEYHQGFGRELAFGHAMAAMRMAESKDVEGASEEMIMQGLKEITMHEVGHTLGLRHNFKASTWLKLDELHDTSITSEKGLTASVMDYLPINLAPKGKKQGHYYTPTIGPYDVWAIEYGYKPFSGGTDGEVKELQKIAARSGEPGHDYATDEDTRGIDSDPLTNRFDMGSDPVAYAKQQAALVKELWPGLVERITEDGEGYQKARRAFGILLAEHGTSMYYASRYIGGLYVSRDHKGDENGQPPFSVVEVEKQREALKILEEQVFSDKPFDFPPELYNYLAASRWNHWGTPYRSRLDYPVHEVIAMWQNRILSQLLSSLTLQRLYDSELKIPADQDAFTTAELLGGLTDTIFAEVSDLKPGEYSLRNPAISSLRRNLQRHYLQRLAYLAMGNTSAPQDCQTMAYMELSDLQTQIEKSLKGKVKLDAYTKAHLQESADRIGKVLDARLSLDRP